MSTVNPQDQLISLAIKELTKIVQDVRDGKAPEMSPTMQKIASELETANTDKSNMSEQQVKEWADRIAREVSKL